MQHIYVLLYNYSSIYSEISLLERIQLPISLTLLISQYLIITILGLKITLKINEENINKIAWWIPFKNWRESFRGKFKVRPDQTRPDQTRPDQTRPNNM